MDPFLAWLESTSFSAWVREEPSIVYGFPGILSLHTIGLGFVAGINAVIALRVLGVAAGMPIAELRRYLTVMWVAFWVNAASGVVLLIGYPTKALTNPVFYLKLAFIGAAVVIVRRLAGSLMPLSGDVGDDTVRRARPLAWLALLCWTGAIFAGRLLAYTHSRLTQEF